MKQNQQKKMVMEQQEIWLISFYSQSNADEARQQFNSAVR